MLGNELLLSPFWVKEEVELLKVLMLLVVILLFCCGIPGSTPLGVVTLLLIKALLLSEDGTIVVGTTAAVMLPLVHIPIAVVSKGLEAVAISGVDDAEKSSPGCEVWEALKVPWLLLGPPNGLPFCLEAFLCNVVLKCRFR